MNEIKVPISKVFEIELVNSKRNISKLETINSFMLKHSLAGINIRLMLEDVYDAYKKDELALQERSSKSW